MRTADGVVAALRARGELWDVAPGLVGLRGNVARLAPPHRARDRAARAARRPEEWSAAAGARACDTLERAEYFASFPFWLTARVAPA